MAEAKNKSADLTEISVEEKLRALYKLQTIKSEIDKIRILRGAESMIHEITSIIKSNFSIILFVAIYYKILRI